MDSKFLFIITGFLTFSEAGALASCLVKATPGRPGNPADPSQSNYWMMLDYYQRIRTNDDVAVLITYFDVHRWHMMREVAVVCDHSMSILYEIQVYRKSKYTSLMPWLMSKQKLKSKDVVKVDPKNNNKLGLSRYKSSQQNLSIDELINLDSVQVM